MNKLTLSLRPRLLKLWLIAIACQAELLFSQLENSSYEDYSASSDPNWFTPDSLQKDQFYSSPYPSFEQSSYSAEPVSYPTESPQDGQWPAFSSNEGFDQTSTPPTDDYRFPSSYSSFEQTFSRDYSDEVMDTDFFTPSPSWSSPDEQSQENAPSYLLPPPSMPAETDYRTFPNAPALSSYSTNPSVHSEAESLNFTTFDSSNNSPTPSADHPLTKEGHAVSYPFEYEFSFPENLSLLKKTPLPPESEPVPSLSQGKSNIKFIKKVQEPISKNTKDQTESVIGKQIVADPIVGVEDLEKPKSKSTITQTDFPALLKNTSLESTTKIAPVELKTHPLPNQTDTTSSDDLKSAEIAQLSTPPALQPQQSGPPITPRAPTVITPNSPSPAPVNAATTNSPQALKEISINFNNVAMIEYIRFISRISNKNFIFDDEELQFNVTIVSEEPTTVENLMAALLQELKIRDLSLIEQGNNILIHRNPRVRSPARIVTDGTEILSSQESELVTRVFRLNTLDPIKASEIIRPLLSEDALVEVLRDTNNLIITDLVTNVNKIAQLISTLDAPNSGVTIGQYVVRNAFVDSLVDLATKILQPIAQGNPFVLVPHPVSNSIFIVSNSFIVEKALAILQNLDLNEGRTKILSLEGLRPSYPSAEEGKPGVGPGGRLIGPGGPGGIPDLSGGLGGISGGPGGPGGIPGELGGPGGLGTGGQFANPEGIPESFTFGGIGAEGRIPQQPAIGPAGYPIGPGVIGAEGRPSAIFDESRAFLPGGIGASTRWSRELPVGHIERTLFFIHKLRYRKGDQIELALRKIALSLQATGTANIDLISAINSSQWIESSNALIFTGTAIALDKVRELVLEVDVPLRQVFIEMLILQTTVDDSLNYSVDWIDRFGGGTTTGEEGFLESPLGTVASVNNFVGGITDVGQGGGGIETIFPNGAQTVPASLAQPLPVATGFLNSGGFVAGIIGTHLTHNGTRFNSIGALLRAIHSNTKANVLLNPKIITEDNNTAEIFVGGTDRYKTQSITNDLGTLVTNNFQFIDVGTTLRVTPLIGNNGIITLEIVQETTAASPTANTGLINQQDFNLIQVLSKTRTVTKIHVPNGFFVILSGMIQDNEMRSFNQIPCLGGIPILGSIGKSQSNVDMKSNLMLFIRPLIIDTDDDLEDITKRQQDIFFEKTKFRRSWNYEIDESLNFLNIKKTDPDEMDCNCLPPYCQ
jgi:type III secretion protein C